MVTRMGGRGSRIAAALLFVVALAGITPPPSPLPAAPPVRAPMVQPAVAKPATAPALPAPAAATPAAFVVKGILTLDGPMEHGDWVWNDEGVADGPIVITVDLKAQMMSVFRGGYEIGTAVILYGTSDKPTPLGVFPITQKKVHHISNLYGAPMPYMLRLTNDGVAIHASNVDYGVASHGCIGIPEAFAAKLFGQARLGDRVIITNGEVLEIDRPVTGA